MMERTCGVLMPVASLPGPYGIGSFGKSAYAFVDFLQAAGQHVWQMLPLNPTGFGDSPYQSGSAFAGNPYFIDLDTLVEQGILFADELADLDWGADESAVDYGAVYAHREAVLRCAYAHWKFAPERGGSWQEFLDFCAAEEAWLPDYVLYMAYKKEYEMRSWQAWPRAVRLRDADTLRAFAESHGAELEFWRFVQFQFSRQWAELHAYATQNGVRIMGDIPFYVSPDSADAWAGGELFEVDEEHRPLRVAGCPPDYFSADGQLWGNPLYNWPKHAKTGYAWWGSRVRRALSLYDILRIDHFRAFDTYWAIPAGDDTARGGEWEPGPRMELFHALEAQLGQDLPIVAEDLGEMFDSVRDLLAESGYPGMCVMQFAFGGGDSEYLPHNHRQNSVVYPGTHDNTTLAAWLRTADKAEVARATAYLGLNTREGKVRGFLRGVLASCARLAVIPMADWLGEGARGRINTPGTLGKNWTWRAPAGALTPELAEQMQAICATFHRA